MADAEVLYRARMVSVQPNGVSKVWFEGPYPSPAQARARVTFWRNHYARNCPGGWQVSGHLESARLSWGVSGI